tara:strand:+ start:144 stop:494 length:351 start_codon:yes stop_codon:yes gene_type:complete
MPGIEKKGRSKIASYKKGSGPCWSGYQMVGMKSKGGRKVPNCVPVKKAKDGKMIKSKDQQRADTVKKQNPHSEYKSDIKKGKFFKPNQLSYTAAKHGTMVRGGGAAIRGLKFQGVK